jgi:glycosyltransferase involved in cell wall biosynthesis
VWRLVVGGQDGGVYDAIKTSYAPPVIYTFTRTAADAGAGLLTKGYLTQGGEAVVITGKNFGGAIKAGAFAALYRTALRRSAQVFFQNPDDRALFIERAWVRPEVTALLPGSGIDLQRFRPVALPHGSAAGAPALRVFRFLLIARMLRDKGVGEFVQAARQLRQSGLQAEFCLLGFLDVQNPAAISRAEMDAWVQEGVVSYLGVSDDVRTAIAEADCIVLPSYREGTPRTLLEAAAMARPIITTNAVGCREVVDDGVNGYLCQVRDAQDLADKMSQMLSLPPEHRTQMGQRGRAKMEAEFDEQIVINKYLAALAKITPKLWSDPD